MEELTTIEAVTPIVEPAREEKVYDKLAVKNLRFIRKGDKNLMVACNLIPTDGVDVLEKPITPVVIENIYEAIADEERPEALRNVLGQAMELVVQAIIAELDYQKGAQEVTEE